MTTTELKALETTNLFALATSALAGGRLSEARAVVDEMARPARAGTCRDLIADARNWPALRGCPDGVIQLLQDRIDQYNALADR